jgi:hypothetical protein
MAELSENNLFITIEKDWFICFREGEHSVGGLSTRLSICFPTAGFRDVKGYLISRFPELIGR